MSLVNRVGEVLKAALAEFRRRLDRIPAGRRSYILEGAILAVLVVTSLVWVCEPGSSGGGKRDTTFTDRPAGKARTSIYLPFLASGPGEEARRAPAATPVPIPTVRPVPTQTPTPPPTATRAPTPTPVPPTPTATPFPGPIAKNTKMGVGVYDSGGGYLMEAIYRLRPSVILLMDPTVEFAREVRRWFPNAFIMGRRFVKEQPLDNPEQRGQQFADLVAERAVPLKGVVDAWMSYNEVTDSGNHANYRAYNAFQVAFAHRLQDHYGIPAVAGNDSTGTVEPDDYARFFKEAIEASSYFGIHAYAPQGAKSIEQDAAYYVLRYRLIYDSLAKAGVRAGPFVLTETGLWDGWRGYVSEDNMAREFMWLSNEMDKDSYMLGQAVFGIFGRDEWRTFEIMGSTLPDRLGGYKEQPKQ